MRGFTAFTGKELQESVRTYRLMILAAVFLILAMMNSLSAKFLPELLGALMPEGMQIQVAEPTVMDAWTQFYKNIPQLGLIVFVVMMSSSLAGEFGRGTLVLLLTKGLRRRTVVLGKFTSAVTVWTLVYVFCAVISYGYAVYFWRSETVSHLLFALSCLWLFGVLLVAVLLLGGVVFKSMSGGILTVGTGVVLLFLLNLIPPLTRWNPLRLATMSTALLGGQIGPGEFLPAVGVACGAGVLLLAGAILIFNKRQIV